MSKKEAGKAEEGSAAETVPSWEVIAGLKRSNIDVIVGKALQIKDEMKLLKAELDKLNEDGLKLLIKANVKTVEVLGNRVTRKDGSSSKLDKELLVKKHGSKVLVWLQECTIKTPTNSFLITRAKEEGDEE